MTSNEVTLPIDQSTTQLSLPYAIDEIQLRDEQLDNVQKVGDTRESSYNVMSSPLPSPHDSGVYMEKEAERLQ